MSASKLKEYSQVRHIAILHDIQYYVSRPFCQIYCFIFCQNHHKIHKINIGIPRRNFASHHFFFISIHVEFRVRGWGGLHWQNIHTVVRENKIQHWNGNTPKKPTCIILMLDSLSSLREERMLQRQILLLFKRGHTECWDMRRWRGSNITHSQQLSLICK